MQTEVLRCPASFASERYAFDPFERITYSTVVDSNLSYYALRMCPLLMQRLRYSREMTIDIVSLFIVEESKVPLKLLLSLLSGFFNPRKIYLATTAIEYDDRGSGSCLCL